MKAKRLFITLLFLGNTFGVMAQLIVDHTVVDKYDDIPDNYIQEVKKMLIAIPGESHSQAYRSGLEFLENIDAKFAVAVSTSGTPPAYTEDNLRIIKQVYTGSSWAGSTGESRWYANPDERANIKTHIQYCNENNLFNTVVGFGWCWDMTWQNAPGGTVDPVFGVRWAGSSEGGPEGSLRWGLDADDQVLTGNSVCMQTYIDATEEYIQFCTQNSINTKVIFTTGPVDGGGNTGENGYQRYLKHQFIRNHVNGNTSRILFDYADILTHNDAGEQNTTTWDSHTYPVIHPDNLLNIADDGTSDVGHIGERGALRLGKAMWWLLARLAGWDGTSGSGDTQAPTAPAGLASGNVTSTSISLSWTASSDNTGVTGYQVLVNNVVQEVVTVTNCVISGLNPSTSYSICVKAKDAAGNISAASNILSITTLGNTITALDNEEINPKIKVRQLSSANVLQIEICDENIKSAQVEITGLSGKKYFERNVNFVESTGYMTNISLPKGIYIIHVLEKNTNYSSKFLIR